MPKYLLTTLRGMTWNDRIKERRLALGMKKVELARLAKVSGPTVTDWESGKIRNIDGENLVNVAHALGVTPEWLINGIGNHHGSDASGFAGEAAWVYRATSEEGRAFMRNMLAVVKASFPAGQRSPNAPLVNSVPKKTASKT